MNAVVRCTLPILCYYACTTPVTVSDIADVPSAPETSQEVLMDIPSDKHGPDFIEDIPVETPLVVLDVIEVIVNDSYETNDSLEISEEYQDVYDTSPEVNPCDEGAFIVKTLSLGGKGFYVKASPGQTLPVVATWSISNPPSCEACTRYVVVGLKEDAGMCMPAGKPATCPSISDGVGLTSIVAPLEPGTYNLYASAPIKADTCAKAKVSWWYNRAVIGAIYVPPGCIGPDCPQTECEPISCETIGKGCGTWGDECRHDLLCGECPLGTECSLRGKCEGPCANGWLEVSAAHVAGSGELASAKVGEVIAVNLDIEIGNHASCQGCKRYLMVGFDSPALCKEIGDVPTCPEFVHAQLTGNITVPKAPGKHPLYVVASSNKGCDIAEQAFNDESTPRVVAATVMVHSSCDPISCDDVSRECGSFGDGCGFNLECGDCVAGKICTNDGKCFCSADDPYEPNNKPLNAYKLGTASDSDVSSHKVILASMENEADWFVINATDATGTVMDPYVRIENHVGKPFHVEVAYVCSNSSKPTIAVQEDSTCPFGGTVDLSSAGLSKRQGFTCDSNGEPVVVHFEPTCAGTIDDSGWLFVGVSSSGYCSSYTMDLHL